MRYFRYVQALDKFLALRIYNVISGLEFFARKKYKGLYQDALDATMEHVLSHYDPSSDNLDHYTMSVLSKILLNANAKEVSSEDVFNIESSKQAYKEDLENGSVYYDIEDEPVSEEDSLDECVQYLLPFFLKDFEMFKTKKVGTRKLKYPGLFEKFRADTIAQAMDLLVDNHYIDASYLAKVSTKTNYRCFPDTRYQASVDHTLEYAGSVNNIVLCKFINSKRKKFIYSLDMSRLIEDIINHFYRVNGIACRDFFGAPVYVTLSGREVIGVENLKSMLENELVGSLLTRMVHIKVLKYEKGKEFLVSSTSDEESKIIFPIFGEDVPLSFQRVVTRRIY